MARRALRLLLTALLAALVAPSASAAPIYESDFSAYLVEWWPDIGFVQNADSVTFSGDPVQRSTTSQEAIPIASFATSQIMLDVTSASLGSDMRLAVSYWTAADVELGWGYIDDITGAGSFGGLLSSASFMPPAGTDFFRVRLELTAGEVEVDNVRVETVPEPETAALLGLGLVALRFARRRPSPRA